MSSLQTTALCLIIFLAFRVRSVGSQERFDCDDDFCSKEENACPELDCESGRTAKNASTCGCCDICIESLKEGSDCPKTEYGWSQAFKECGHGLYCNEKGKCEATECLKKLRKYTKEQYNSTTIMKVNFTCDHFGSYNPVVCISDILCFCVNEEGKRIFGTDFAVNNGSMKCDCSRDISDFPKEVEDPTLFPHCLPSGNYDPLQCTEDKCFCMKSATRYEEDDVPNDATSIRKLSCYDGVRHAKGRSTKCLKEREEQMQLFNQNHTVIGLELIRCNLDGSYFPVQCDPGRCFCVSRKGKIYDDTVTKKKKAKQMTCKCLRDKEIMEDLDEKENIKKYFQELECDELGNYKSNTTIIPDAFFGDFM